MSDIQTKSIGLVLSGGGVRGMAHIGLIQAMNEFGLSAEIVGGSSVGALVGALYANGNSVPEMMAFFRETPLFRYNFLTIVKPGFIDTDRYFDVFRAHFPEDSFEALQKGLHVVATNLQKGDLEYFSKGELIRPLLASAALPPVFSPVEMEGQLYADGGIMNNFPLEPIAGKADFIIGSNVSVVGELNKNALKNSLQLTGRVTGLMIYAINRSKLEACDLLMEFKELEKIGVLDRKGLEKAYLVGYENTARKLEELLKKPQL
ncbi:MULTISPECIES: patatin-like phospholipase family protein [Zobellia]|uniref:patatin-like phospholipase family protein n=1 Tax=Zobellia TaxID=112040 RepID=UPI001BFF4122|nr:MULTISPECIES: patatin-like phospholipase family protein [Zobellia]MBT9186932.1 patatin-like phospholipase family protein [Zobellia russellii]MBU2974868.1 patatin-like phospholipase family protein [Zobellia sp. B3R18]